MKFELDAEQIKKLEAWRKAINAEGVAKQKKHYNGVAPHFAYAASWEMGYPYTGAIGGGETFCFTETGLGTICVVKDATTNQEIDLTDYESW